MDASSQNLNVVGNEKKLNINKVLELDKVDKNSLIVVFIENPNLKSRYLYIFQNI